MTNQPIIIHTSAEPDRQVRQVSDQSPPLRVQVALHFIRHFTEKTEVKALPTKGCDEAAEWIPLERVELTVQEKDAYDAALRLIENYFDGNMKEASLEIVERQREEERMRQTRLDGGPLLVMDCPQCGGGPNQYRCMVCRTKGKVTIGLAP